MLLLGERFVLPCYFKYLSGISLLAVLISSCANRSLYLPQTQNTPLFSKERQLNCTGYIGENHVELQSAFNPVNHVAFAGNINLGCGIGSYDYAVGTYGYSENKRWRYELFGGYGFNTNHMSTRNYIDPLAKDKINYTLNSIYNRSYLQPCIGYFGEIKMYKLNFSFSAASKISHLFFQRFQYNKTDVTQTTLTGAPVYLVNRDLAGKEVFLLEPCVTNKVGMKNIYGILQLQGIIYYSSQMDLRNINFSSRLLFSVGVGYNIVFKRRHS